MDEHACILIDSPGAEFQPGDEVVFTINLKGNIEDPQVCISNDGYKVFLHQPLALHNGTAQVAGTLTEPGFLQCRVNYLEDHKPKTLIRTAAFDPYNVEPTATAPDDFDEFWDEQKKILRACPLHVELEPVPSEKTADSISLHSLRMTHMENTGIFGYLAKPLDTAAGCPVVLVLQNHGGGAWSVPVDWATNLAEKGFVCLAINTHDVENGREQSYYDTINQGRMASYTLQGFLNRNDYYFKTAYLRIVRAIDYLTSLPEWDRKSVILTGRSQGGGMSLVGAGLDDRVTGLVCAVPALCELGAHKFGRPAGWPRMVPADEMDYGESPNAPTINGHGPVSERVYQVSRYFDAVNFCRKIECPVRMHIGLVDTCVPPTTAFSAFNAIASSSKQITTSNHLGHGADSDPIYTRDAWIIEMAKNKGSRL